MNLDIYNDSNEEFEERLEKLYNTMETLVEGLKDSTLYEANINELFREIHTLKALSFYLELDTVFKTLHALENILSILHHKKPPIREEILDWLLLFSDHISSWYTVLKEGGTEYEAIDALTINMLSGVVTLSKKGSEILKGLNLMTMGVTGSGCEQIEPKIRKSCNTYVVETNIKAALQKMLKIQIDIVMLPARMGFDNLYLLIKKIKEHNVALPIIVFDPNILSEQNRNYLKRFGIEHYIEGDIRESKVLNKLHLLASAYYQDTGIKFLNSPMLEAIENLKPLPQSLLDINEYRLNPDAPVSELTAIIMKDAQLAAKILKYVNSATFNLAANVASIQHAISLLGRDAVIALALQTVIDDTFTIDLSPYGVSVEQFYDVSQKRVLLVMQWYRKVSLPHLSILTTAALLGSIGQILIADDIIRREESIRFKSLVASTEPVAAEVEFTHTTAEDVTADIMTHWGLDDELVNVVRYSRDLANAPRELKNLALAIHVVFKTCSSDSRDLEQDDKEHLCELLSELNFEPKYYTDALEKLSL